MWPKGFLRSRLLPPRLLRLIQRSLLIVAVVLASGSFLLWAQSRSSRSSGGSSGRVDLRPNLTPGQVLRYQVQLQTVTATKQTGAVSDPEGPSRLGVTWDATIRLEVLSAQSGTAANSQSADVTVSKTIGGGSKATTVPLRIRTTYEHSAASVKSDSPDPDSERVQQSYSRLEGQVIEFTVGADGHVSDVHGLEGIIDDDKVRQAAQQWMEQVSGSASAPQGVTLGQSWNSAQPADSVPIKGMIWRSNSTYVRNESCRPAESNASGLAAEACAVILTRQSVVQGKKQRDPTPEDYRSNGLRTSGQWSGSGESLSYISLRTHLTVSVTEDSSQKIDFTVTNSSGRSIRYAGTIATHSQVALLPAENGDSK